MCRCAVGRGGGYRRRVVRRAAGVRLWRVVGACGRRGSRVVGRRCEVASPAHHPRVVDGRVKLFAVELRNDPVQRGPEGGPYVCPCCGSVTLAERGGFECCPVCWWEDDGQDDPDADVVLGGPNGDLSLTDARRNFARYGASDPRYVQHVRPPRLEEMPPTGHGRTS
ncbi:CPCC family cysteine-rich protein [Phytohabitans kaempferiae]|uniref:CPCC family cysteine-rich protein n=1 Tax=Phytohabitans kaempferiae TaxID=1620943 RepID=A0ABV6LYA1_9ACTN